MKRLFLILLFIPQFVLGQQLSWPEITKENKPWSRWWWPGSIVNEASISSNIKSSYDAGLGGLEIAVIYGVKGQEDKFINYLSPKWMDMFIYTLEEAKKNDIGIDLANASGWPFGGPWVDPSDACKNINYKTYHLSGGESLNEKVEFIQQPLVRAIGTKPDITKLIDPIGKNDNLQLYALDQIRFEKPLPLYSLTAHSSQGEYMELTNLVSSDGLLNWTAPDGDWTLYALFQGWHGKLAERAGPGGEGDVIDHFSGRAIDNYLNHFDNIFKDYDLSYLRGYFNDSYEVDDASGESDWTPDLFSEFYNRREYDLSKHLPALFQNDTPENNSRVLADYRQTISELLLEKYTTHWRVWANKQGKTIRNQAHGSPANILDLYAASDIPETEGRDILSLKFASSAAHVSGKQYASCEAATWLNEHFISNLSDVKTAVDLFLLAGINHLFYHGTCFSPPDEPWPGFLFYAAVEFTPTNPFWHDFKALNSYIANIQTFMQSGIPDDDILLYFPIFDRYSEYDGRNRLQHFNSMNQKYNGTHFRNGAEGILNDGYSFDYISDLQILNTEENEKKLLTEGKEYKTLILPQCEYIPFETFSQIMKLADEGATIIVYGDFPSNISGWYEYQAKTEAYKRIIASLTFSPTSTPDVSKASVGEGMILKGENLSGLLSLASAKREPMAKDNISYVRRKTDNGYYYLINNRAAQSFEGWLPIASEGVTYALFNPMTRQFGKAQARVDGEQTSIYVELEAGESMVIASYDTPMTGDNYLFCKPTATPTAIEGPWNVEFVEGGPTLPKVQPINELVSWTEFGGQEVKDFSGTVVYTTNFRKPKAKGDKWIIDLGEVAESATVILNGEEITSLIGPQFSFTIDDKRLKKKNSLSIRVSNLMANRIAYMDRNGIEWKKFYNVNMSARMGQNNKNGVFDASAWEPRSSGLLGPVTITPASSYEEQ